MSKIIVRKIIPIEGLLRTGQTFALRGKGHLLVIHVPSMAVRNDVFVGNTKRGVNQYFFLIVIMTSLDSLQFNQRNVFIKYRKGLNTISDNFSKH